jgi:hypothetical protein
MSAPPPIAPVSQAASSAAAAEHATGSFSQLPPNNTQPQLAEQVVAASGNAGMPLPSLTQLLPIADTSAAQLQHFVQTPAVQDRLTAECRKFSDAASALQAARVCRDRFVAAGSRKGGSKQLPKRLDWKLAQQVVLSSQAAPDNFHHAALATLRTIEREATDKAFDTILAAMDSHITYLRGRSNARDFVSSAVLAFDPELQRLATAFNAQSQADPTAASQSLFAFPTRAVASYFAAELLTRLNEQMLARVASEQQQQQRLADERAEEHKSQETVLAGAHTGQTIAMLAQKEVSKAVAPLQRQIAQLQQRLEKQPTDSDRRMHLHSRSNSHRSNASAAIAADARATSNNRHQRPASHSASTAGQKRPHSGQQHHDGGGNDIDSSSERQSRTVTFSDIEQHPAPKRHKPIVVTVKPKNGAGGDRHQRRAEVPIRQHANKQGRGPRSDDQQQPARQ